MLWDKKYNLDYFLDMVDKWSSENFLGDCPIDAQYGLDLVFKTLIDDKEKYSYLTSMPETNEQTNSLIIDLILTKYSRKYRKLKKKRKKDSKRGKKNVL